MMTTLERVQRFLRTNGIWDVAYEDKSHLSDRLARFIDEEFQISDFEWNRREYLRIADEARKHRCYVKPCRCQGDQS